MKLLDERRVEQYPRTFIPNRLLEHGETRLRLVALRAPSGRPQSLSQILEMNRLNTAAFSNLGTIRSAIATKWHGDSALTLTFRDANGKPIERLVYRHDEPTFEAVESGRAWSFDADGALLRLQVVENALDREKLQALIEEKALAQDAMDAARVQRIRSRPNADGLRDYSVAWGSR